MHTFTRLLALLLLVAGLTPLAQATHIQGGTLTYTTLGNNQYRVILKHFRDCSGVSAPVSPTLECHTGAACNLQPNLTVQMTLQGVPMFGNQYCATLSGVCTTTGPANYETNTYVATVTLPPADTWVLSSQDCCRPSTANLVGQDAFRFETVLHNRVTVGGAVQIIANTSPVSSNMPVFFIPWKQLSILGNSAFDADGDSLVYSLVNPLQTCGTSSMYASRPASPISGIISQNPPCAFINTAVSLVYTAALPVNVTIDTTGTCPLRTSTVRFQFDPATGGIALEPATYNAVAPSAAGLNKYVVVVQIQELRRLGGQWVEVGVTRRELFLTVYNCGTNVPPTLARTATLHVGTTRQTQQLSQVIPVLAGEPVVLDLVATDRNAGQSITMSLAYNAVPGAVLTPTGTGTARLTFTPPQNLPSGTYRVAVTTEDNNCPIKGHETQTLVFRVSATVLGTRAGRAATAVAAWPMPFADVVQFQLPTSGAKILNVTDALGRTVATLLTSATGAGRWQPAADIAPGLYLARTADGNAMVRLLYQPE